MSVSRLSSAQTHLALDVTVAVTCGLALLTLFFLARQPTDSPSMPPDAEPAELPGAWRPWAGFLGVCALLVLNQLVVNAYILRTHAGDPSFITRFLGHGWFALAPEAPPVRWLAANLPDRWLSGPLGYSVLRVQAVLELPFALLAYLAVVAMLDLGLYRQLLHSALLPLAAISFTFTFCLIELRLYNPFTQSDLYARWLAAGAVLVLWGMRRRRAIGQPQPRLGAPRLGLLGLLMFFVGAAATGAVVLGMYDVALLYNFGHLPARLPILVAGVVLGTLAALARSLPGFGRPSRPGPGLLALSSVLAAFAAVFFAPSLSIRYCGSRLSAVAAAALLFLAALGLGLRLCSGALAQHGLPGWRALLGLALALVTARLLLLGEVASSLFGTAQPLRELVLLQHAALIFPVAALLVWALDRLLAGVGAKSR